LPRNGEPDVDFVLMIGDEQLDWLASTDPPKSSIAMRALSAPPGPDKSA
jgi:hypothetical protein